MTERGSPMVAGSVVFKDCGVAGLHFYGDHTVFAGEGRDAVGEDGAPPVFFDARFQDRAGGPVG